MAENKDFNRIKLMLVEKKRTSKWLAERLDKAPATISKWCTNSSQPTLDVMMGLQTCLTAMFAN